MSDTGSASNTYVYDTMNPRARVQTVSSINEYLYDYAGRRISSRNPTTNIGNEGRIYWDGRQICLPGDRR